MDLSQLPKMSDTPKPPPPMAEPPAAPAVYREPSGVGPVAVWISLVIGLIFLMLGANFLRWAAAKLGGREFVTGWFQPDGVTPVKYFELQGGTAWGETGFFAMGVALLIDALLLFFVYRSPTPRRGLLALALATTALALALNVGAAGYVFTLGILPFSSMIAILVGGIMLFEQLGLWREPR